MIAISSTRDKKLYTSHIKEMYEERLF